MAKYTDGAKIDVIAATISSIMPPPPPSSSTPVLFPGCRIFHFAASNLVRNSLHIKMPVIVSDLTQDVSEESLYLRRYINDIRTIMALIISEQLLIT
jgi:hypothetical protein